MLQNEMTRQGIWMYRWRGYLPLLMTPIVVYGFNEFQYPENSHFYDTAWEFFCLFISLAGLAIRFAVMGSSPAGTSYVGRSTRGDKKRRLKTTGLYSLCRNPLYLGNFLMGLGVFLFVRSLFVTGSYVFFFILYYERLILGEEEFLAREYGREYLEWAERIPLIFPRFLKWVKPGVPFSWRIALRREYKRVFGVLFLMTAMEVSGDIVIKGNFEVDFLWIFIFAVGLLFYLTVLFLKRKSHFLDVPR